MEQECGWPIKEATEHSVPDSDKGTQTHCREGALSYQRSENVCDHHRYWRERLDVRPKRNMYLKYRICNLQCIYIYIVITYKYAVCILHLTVYTHTHILNTCLFKSTKG